MNFVNLAVKDLRSIEFILSSHTERGIWVMLYGFCAMQENGGIIRNAKFLRDEEWMQACGVKLADLRKKASKLWHWSHNDLHVTFYSSSWETSIKNKRHAANKTNAKRWKKRRSRKKSSEALSESMSESHSESLSDTHSESLPAKKRKSLSDTHSESQGKVMEGKVREGKERGRAKARSLPDSDVHIPSKQELLDWACGTAGVDPDYVLDRAARFTEKHSWVANGRLIDWRKTLARYWSKDRDEWCAEQKKRAAASSAANGAAAGRLPDDDPKWWTMPVEELNAWLHGLLMTQPPPPITERVRTIWQSRTKSSARA